jgi:hypothetical protein
LLISRLPLLTRLRTQDRTSGAIETVSLDKYIRSIASSWYVFFFRLISAIHGSAATPKLAGGKGKGKGKAEPSENYQSVKAAKPEPSESKAQDEIKALKAELVKQKRRHASPEAAPTITSESYR